jgi:SWI/SNF-related matrix-associated actin-dependent regulator 1 of chromatin subfamily A
MLADAPGVGKSAQVARACDLLKPEAGLVLVPNQTLAVNLAREFGKWSLWGHDAHFLRSGKDKLPDTGLVFTTYALAARAEVLRRLVKRRCDVLICDEAHALKSRDAARTKAVLQKSGLAGKAKRIWLLTGTPAPNHAGELYVFARTCGAWPSSFKAFAERFCVLRENAFGVQIAGSKNHEELKTFLAPHYLRRVAVEGRPALTVDEMHVEAARGADPYESLKPEDRAAVLAALDSGDWQLSEIPAVATARRLVGLAKADGVAEIAAANLDGGYGKLLIFCQHTAVIERIAELLKSYGVAIYSGATPQRERVAIVDSFQGDGGPRVIVAQARAASEGLTLTKANRVIIGEPSWTPHENDQAICRAWRRGQRETVLASFIALNGSLDERITAALHRKPKDIALLV